MKKSQKINIQDLTNEKLRNVFDDVVKKVKRVLWYYFIQISSVIRDTDTLTRLSASSLLIFRSQSRHGYLWNLMAFLFKRYPTLKIVFFLLLFPILFNGNLISLHLIVSRDIICENKTKKTSITRHFRYGWILFFYDFKFHWALLDFVVSHSTNWDTKTRLLDWNLIAKICGIFFHLFTCSVIGNPMLTSCQQTLTSWYEYNCTRDSNQIVISFSTEKKKIFSLIIRDEIPRLWTPPRQSTRQRSHRSWATTLKSSNSEF